MASNWCEIDDTLIVVKVEASCGKCQCCLSEAAAALRSMSQSILHEGIQETYCSMLMSCFSLELLEDKESLVICDKCIMRLKDGCAFKNQVLLAQNKIKMELYGDQTIYKHNERQLQTVYLPSEELCSAPVENVSLSGVVIKRIKKEESTPLKGSIERIASETLVNKSMKSSGIIKDAKMRKTTTRNTQRITRTNMNIQIKKNNRMKIQSKSLMELAVKNESGILDPLSLTNECMVKDLPKDKRLARRRIMDKLKREKELPFKINKTDRCCPVCQKGFAGHTVLLSHMSIHFPNFVCSLCGKPFVTKGALRGHLLRNHKTPPITYQVKKNNITSAIDALQPIFRKSLSELSKDERLARRRILEKLNREKNLPFKIEKSERCCPVCKEEFNGYNILISHMSVHYPNCVCSQCGKPFATILQLKTHQRLHHKNHPRLPCKVCGKVIKKCNMLRHVRNHSGVDNIYCCPSCPQRFKTFAMRLSHIAELHNGDTHRYKCKLCPKVFRLGPSLNSHVRTFHLKERKYCCSECDKAYFDRGTLNEHMRSHTGESFKCEICLKGYIRKARLKAHIKIHHADPEQDVSTR